MWPSTDGLHDEEREAAQVQMISRFAKKGGWVGSQTDFQAVMDSGHRPNHLLHLILRILTAGLLLIVGLTNREERSVVMIDEYGRITG